MKTLIIGGVILLVILGIAVFSLIILFVSDLSTVMEQKNDR